jgi:hypothetical protein
MKKGLFIALSLFCSGVLMAQKKKHSVEAAVAGFFNGLSIRNADTLKYYATADFQLLEDGEVWNMDSLINKMKPLKGSAITRLNQFDFISTRISGNMAWVSYHNTAEFRKGENTKLVKWLESAVLIKTGGRWKIQMMHSTPLQE